MLKIHFKDLGEKFPKFQVLVFFCWGQSCGYIKSINKVFGLVLVFVLVTCPKTLEFVFYSKYYLMKSIIDIFFGKYLLKVNYNVITLIFN